MALPFALNRRSQVPAEQSSGFGAIAERFRRAGDLDRAVALCKEGLQKFPEHLSARVTLGWALLDLGKHEEARVELERVLRRAPDNLAAIRGLAELHDRVERSVEHIDTPAASWPPPSPEPAPAPAIFSPILTSAVADEEVTDGFPEFESTADAAAHFAVMAPSPVATSSPISVPPAFVAPTYAGLTFAPEAAEPVAESTLPAMPQFYQPAAMADQPEEPALPFEAPAPIEQTVVAPPVAAAAAHPDEQMHVVFSESADPGEVVETMSSDPATLDDFDPVFPSPSGVELASEALAFGLPAERHADQIAEPFSVPVPVEPALELHEPAPVFEVALPEPVLEAAASEPIVEVLPAEPVVEVLPPEPVALAIPESPVTFPVRNPGGKNQTAVAALEKLLRRVEARRLNALAGSLAS